MRDHKASRTALGVALRRAAHQILDNPPVFEDPLALSIIGPEGRSRIDDAISRNDPGSLPSLRAFVAARSRYAEDRLGQAVDRGVRQYVLLGAGLDTFAYRNPYAGSGLRVFEVDHPSTQEWKRDRLHSAGIAVPDEMRFVPVNFELQSLEEELEASGFRAAEGSFFSCLGVAPYLTESAFNATMSYVARMAPASGIVFDYGIPKTLLSPRDRLLFKALADRVASAGEPLRLFFEPEELAVRLQQLGFGHLEDLDVAAINARYFPNRSDGLEVTSGFAHLMWAGL